jgi:hypothetical protein
VRRRDDGRSGEDRLRLAASDRRSQPGACCSAGEGLTPGYKLGSQISNTGPTVRYFLDGKTLIAAASP